jgi:DNA repair protein RecN (Recombination protein N)
MDVDFTTGLTTITGETGAGKSILLGGLGLVLGNRAESNTLLDPSVKCIIEAEFRIDNYNLNDFFKEEDLDYDTNTVIRRELLPSGKSRAFVNDTPVKLEVLTKLKQHLVDIHSQHQTLQINKPTYQFNILDTRVENKELLKAFRKAYKHYLKLEKELEQYKLLIQKESNQHDYHAFLFEELEKSAFFNGEQEELELELEQLNNVELIQQNLASAVQLLSNEELGLTTQLQQLKTALNKIQDFDPRYKILFERVSSAQIELSDIEDESINLVETVSFSPQRLEEVSARLELLYHLYKKTQVTRISNLSKILEELEAKINRVENFDRELEAKSALLNSSREKVVKLAQKLHDNRQSKAPRLATELTQILKDLGMPNAQFKIEVKRLESLNQFGQDQIQFLFTANKGGELADLKQVASGGELSRVMLAIKSVMSQYTHLPTMVFDEIDTGLSGEIAIKMARIMQQMSEQMQVISITHLPQIAAFGTQQMKVYKNQVNQRTQSHIKLLTKEERIIELAEMLGGKDLSETAINHAKQLLS